MSRWTSLTLSLALAATSTPVVAADPTGALIGEIQRARDRHHFADAAKLARSASRRIDFSTAHRYLFAGLASQSHGDAFAHGGAPREPRGDPRYLCDRRMVLQEAAPLATDEQQSVSVWTALEGVTQQLVTVAASGRAVPCELPHPKSEAPPAVDERATVHTEPPDASPTPAPKTVMTRKLSLRPAVEGPAPLPPAPLLRRRPPARVGVGVSLLVASAGLVGGLVACLAARGRMNSTISALDATATAERRNLTPQEVAVAATANARYGRLGYGIAALGAVAGFSFITGLLLLAVPPRPTSMARMRPTGTGIQVTF